MSETLQFLPLGPGKVRPEGWLRDWAVKAGEGITGHLDERASTFAKGWSGESFEARGVREGGTHWPLEQSAYWLDGLVRLAYILNDSSLIHKARSRLDPIVEGVLSGGPSFIYWRPLNQLESGFDNWAHSHMGRAMVAYYQATEDPRVLEALVRAYRRYPLPELTPHFHPVTGAVNVDPMLDTYLMSGDSILLGTLLDFAGSPVYNETVDHWLNGNMTTGHTVIYYENIRVPAILYVLTGKEKYLNATRDALEWGMQRHGLPVGLVSGEEFSAGTGPFRNVETCNVAAGPWSINWMYRITGNREYGDQLEQIFFNAGPAPIASDFQTMCYYQSPNRISPSLPGEEPFNPGQGSGSYLFTEIGHEVLCCVGNSNRIIPNYIMHMWMRPVEGGGLAATLYGPNTLETTVNGIPVRILSETAYPYEETIRMKINPDRKTRFTLSLRIPGWCQSPTLTLNGASVIPEIDAGGFVHLEREWKSGDVLDLVLPMQVEMITGKTNSYPDIPYFKEREGVRSLARVEGLEFPYGSVHYGPQLFALPIPDANPNEVLQEVPFNYALNIRSADEVIVEREYMPEHWEWSLRDLPLRLKVPALQFDWQPTEHQALPLSCIEDGHETKIDLVPYGQTKFRISMFPVSEASREALQARR